MAAITIRNLDDATKARLRIQAARNQRSMEEEARHLLRNALTVQDAKTSSLATAIRRRFRPLGGVDIPLPEREAMRKPPRPGK